MNERGKPRQSDAVRKFLEKIDLASVVVALAGLVLRIGTTRFSVDTGLADLSDFTHKPKETD